MADNHLQIKNKGAWKKARRQCLERDQHTCVTCGATDDLTVDHIIPLDRLLKTGGDPYDLNNLRVLCRSCNSRKGARDELRLPYLAGNWRGVF